MLENQLQIVVLGAGYAGLLAAVRLAGKTRGQGAVITLVNASDRFVERPRLHQFAANRFIAPRPIAEVLKGTPVRFVQGIVTGIDTSRREVTVLREGQSEQLAYDKMIYALGSTIDRDSVPGVSDQAFTLTPTGPRSAETLRQVLPALNANGGRLLVGGGGATGIEAAAEFADAYPNLHVELVTRGAFGRFRNEFVATYMRRALGRLGVTIREQTTIVRVEAGRVGTAAGDGIPFDVFLWAGGFGVPPLAREAGLSVNERGQVLIDPFMRSISHPDIFAAGDAAHPVHDPGAPVRMAALTSAIMGAGVADAVSAVIQGKAPPPFSFAYLGQGIALGSRDAIGLNNYPDDTPGPPYLTGRAGVAGREFFVRLLADLPNLERRWPGITVWPGKGRYAAAQRRARRNLPVAQV